MLRTQHNMTGQDSWYLQTSNCSGMWLPWLVLDQINILSRVSLVENSNYCSCSDKTDLKYCCGPFSFYLNEVKSESTERRCPLSTVSRSRIISMFTVLTPLCSLLFVAIHYCLFTRGQAGPGQARLSVWLNSPGPQDCGSPLSSPVRNISRVPSNYNKIHF